MSDLTSMDCWHYIAPLIPITSEDWTKDVYVMIFNALKQADECEKDKKKEEGNQ